MPQIKKITAGNVLCLSKNVIRNVLIMPEVTNFTIHSDGSHFCSHTWHLDWCFLEFKHLISGTFAKSFICYFEFAERHLSFEVYAHWLWCHLLEWIYRERCVGLNKAWTQKRWYHLSIYSTYQLVEPLLRVCGTYCPLRVTELWEEIRRLVNL